jgi:hypothetical protein
LEIGGKVNMISRDTIINVIKERFIPMKEVHAYWLEGSDALNAVDEYSDVDIWLDVDDGYEDIVFQLAEEEFLKLGALDFKFRVNHEHPKIHQHFYHIEGSSEYLLIDFCIQSHSRDRNEYKYVEGDILELPKVIFDKTGIITIVKEDEVVDTSLILDRINEISSRYKQHSRVIKYVERNNYPEAFIYYLKFVADPLVELMRIKYTPKYHYLHFIHISNHIPKEETSRLEYYYQISSLDDIRVKTMEAKETCNNLIKEIQEKYNL